MCDGCESAYEDLSDKYTTEKAELEAKIEALESALKESLKCYKRISDENYSLVCQNTHLMKKAYYDHRT